MSASLFPSRQHDALKLLPRFRGENTSAELQLNALTRSVRSTEIASTIASSHWLRLADEILQRTMSAPQSGLALSTLRQLEAMFQVGSFAMRAAC
jgi:hypothetical protein